MSQQQSLQGYIKGLNPLAQASQGALANAVSSMGDVFKELALIFSNEGKIIQLLAEAKKIATQLEAEQTVTAAQQDAQVSKNQGYEGIVGGGVSLVGGAAQIKDSLFPSDDIRNTKVQYDRANEIKSIIDKQLATPNRLTTEAGVIKNTETDTERSEGTNTLIKNMQKSDFSTQEEYFNKKTPDGLLQKIKYGTCEITGKFAKGLQNEKTEPIQDIKDALSFATDDELKDILSTIDVKGKQEQFNTQIQKQQNEIQFYNALTSIGQGFSKYFEFSSASAKTKGGYAQALKTIGDMLNSITSSSQNATINQRSQSMDAWTSWIRSFGSLTQA